MPNHKPDYSQFEEEDEDQEEPIRRRCRHILTAGRRCGSPCLRTEQFCYHHHTTRRPVADPIARRARTGTFDLPHPDDRDAIRAAVAQVTQAIAHNAIDLKRAGMLLYSLQISLCALPPQPRPLPITPKNSNPAKDMVEDTVLDETHGVIAPEEEYEEPEEFRPHKSLGRQMLEEVERYEAQQAAEAARQALESAESDDPDLDEEPSLDSETRVFPNPQRPPAIDLRAAAEPTADPALEDEAGALHLDSEMWVRLGTRIRSRHRLMRRQSLSKSLLKHPVLVKGTALAVP